MAAHLACGAGGGAEVVVLALVVPLLHGQRHVQALVRDGEQVLAATPALLVVAPHALLRIGLGEGGQLLVPPLRVRLRGGGEDASGSVEAGKEGGEREVRMSKLGEDQKRRWRVFWGASGGRRPSPPCRVTRGHDLEHSCADGALLWGGGRVYHPRPWS